MPMRLLSSTATVSATRTEPLADVRIETWCEISRHPETKSTAAMDYQRITSAQNAHVKNAVRLRQRRGREQQNRILIDGRREIERAIEGRVSIEEIFLSESFFEQHRDSPTLQRFSSAARLLILPEKLVGRISYGQRDEGPVAVAATPSKQLLQLRLPENPLIAVLEGVEKPGNVGAVLRSADASGIDAVIVADGRTDLYNPNAVRASLGTIFTLQVCSCSDREAVDWLATRQLQVAVACVDAELSYEQYDFCRGTAIVLGSEAKGVSQMWRDNDFRDISLPMCGAADSLNVSATAAVLFFEANRQRRVAKK